MEGKLKRSLVTGGAGFLGSHLTTKLLKLGHRVLVVDNFSTGSRRNLNHLSSHPHLEVLCHDLCFPFYAEVDEIYHLAAPASPLFHQQDPIQTLKTNVQGSLNMLELAKRLDCKILLSSSSTIYGMPTCHPQPENYLGRLDFTAPHASYDQGKRSAETLFLDYQRMQGIKIKIARLFNGYGPHMQLHNGNVISNFIGQALTGKPLTLYDEGYQSRSFCYVNDLIEGLIALMDSDPTFVTPCNLGSPVEYSIRELAGLILEITRSTSTITFQNSPYPTPPKRSPDLTLAKTKLNWYPTMDLKEGLEKSLAFFKKEAHYSAQFI